MSQQLTIQYGLKTFKVKTTPSMSLKDVLDKSVEHFKLDTINNDYGLLKGKVDLELMIPMRLANLPQGCNLTLASKPKSKSASGSKSELVNVKLQVNDSSISQPLILLVDPLNTVKDIVKRFEIEFKVELLNKFEIVTKKVIGSVQSIKVEYKPTLQIFTTIISDEAAFEKLLTHYGINKGSVVIRLSFQKSAETLISEQTDIEMTPREEEEIMVNEREELNDLVELEILEQKEKKFEELEEETTKDESMMATDGDEDLATPKLFNPLRDNFVVEKEDDKSYDMSIDQAKLYHKMITNSGLNDRTRQKLSLQKKTHPIKFVSVRIKFPDLSILELSFEKDEKVKKIYEVLINTYLKDANLQFELYQSYPHKVIDPSEDLIADALGLKTVLLLSTKSTGPVLKQNIKLANLTYAVDQRDGSSGDEEIINDKSSSVNEAPVKQNAPSSSSGKKVPKWLKLGKK